MQAVLIMAHNNLKQVQFLAEALSSVFKVYVHIDKKINKEGVFDTENIKVFSFFHINWGSANLLYAILALMKEALKDPSISYVHVISGEDWFCKKPNEIYDFFEDKNNIYFKLGEMHKKAYMQKYYSFLNIIDYRKKRNKIIVRMLWFTQRLLHINRFEKLDVKMRTALVWGDYPRDACEYCLQYIEDNPEILSFLEYGFASDEFFFPTVFYVSNKMKGRIVNKNFRYMKWEKRNGSYPAILDESDLDEAVSGEYMFMRKVRFPISENLIKKINEKIKEI